MTERNKARITGIGTVAVPVSDQDKAVEFYVGLLGLEKRMDVPLEQIGGRWITVAPDGAVTSIALVPGESTGVDTGIRLNADDVPAVHARLEEQGVDVDDLLQWPGVPPMFTLRDRDGNVLVIVE
ncbi:VOC family protein [Actinomadura viridis]|uniref:Catechol 2,3-dioxygenase-like lactoylglutathione lyase family enzyme n=1 Tax=Actinomadura viridis TaxID=58110 RepID=A0A931GUH9_9ACTN|nr:VOC family protein [Actinomadura viridis]MBG6093184.1 catechol 2,3-dioxygenase-like lactoylglutathione lyase family enzyme [Actinomadura viridis]